MQSGAKDLSRSRVGVRLHHLANTTRVPSGSSTLQVDSLHSREQLRRYHHDRAIHSTSQSPASVDMMTQPGKFAYTVMYVGDVAQTAEFYQNAFGIGVRRLDHSGRWGELESGATTIAFTTLKQHETDITGGVQTADLGQPRHNVELCFTYPDVDAAFKHAVSVGAVPVAKPEEKEWGQKVGYVRDVNGVMIRIGSHMEGS